MKRITSRENPQYRQLLALQKPAKAREQNRILVEGLRLCRDVVESGLPVRQVIISDTGLEHEAIRAFAASLQPAETLHFTDALMQQLCRTRQPQGIALVCPSPLLQAPVQKPGKQGLYLVADQVQDPGNLGTLIRTAAAFAFDAVLITRGTVSPLNDKVVRASMGSVFHLPLIEFEGLTQLAAWLSESSIPLLAADLSGTSILEQPLPLPAALLIGNEARGLSPESRRLAERLVHIPMPGKAESLNAAAAAAILCYEMMRCREAKEGQSAET